MSAPPAATLTWHHHYVWLAFVIKETKHVTTTLPSPANNHNTNQLMFYRNVITTKAQAFCHLLLYFSLYEDEAFEGEETLQVFSILQQYSFAAKADFPEDVNLFFDYKKNLGNEKDYFAFLTQLIDSEAPLLILFHAAQVAMSDTIYSDSDEASLLVLSDVLGLEKEQERTIIKLALGQRMIKVKDDF